MVEPDRASVRTQSGADSIETYLRAKDGNRPHLMASAFTGDALLEMVVKTGTIAFPPITRGLGPITEVLVSRFGQMFENVYTFCLALPPRAGEVEYSCNWLVGMTEKESGKVRVGCGYYEWSFLPGSPQLADRLKITVEMMLLLPPQRLSEVIGWLSPLPYPWCPGQLAISTAPRFDDLRPVVEFLKKR